MSRMWRGWTVLILFAIGTSLITPLIPLYQDKLGFNDTVVTLFLGCYVVALVPSMLTLGQLSDRVGRKGVLLGGLVTLGVAQAFLITEPGLAGLLAARAVQGLATGAFLGTCTAYIVDLAPTEKMSATGSRRMVSALASVSVRGGLGLGPGLGGLIAQYAMEPLRLPFELHLIAIVVAIVLVLTLPETITERSRRPLTLRLEVPRAERAVFWRVLVPSGMLFSLFDGTSLALVPVFLVRTIGTTNLIVVGAAGFLVLVSGALSPLLVPRLGPQPAIIGGLTVASLAWVGVVAGAPLESAGLVLAAVAVTGAAAGLVFKGGVDLCTQIAPPTDRGKLISSYYVAGYLGGFSVPLVIVGALSDLVGLTTALACLSVAGLAGALWILLVGRLTIDELTGGPESVARSRQ